MGTPSRLNVNVGVIPEFMAWVGAGLIPCIPAAQNINVAWETPRFCPGIWGVILVVSQG